MSQSTDASYISLPAYENLVISGHHGAMVTISMKDGSVTFHDGYNLDEAAKTFWLAVGVRMPK